MKKVSWVERLRKWRKEKEEQYAHAIMGKPEKTTILRLFRMPGVVLIMGSRRGGKTAAAHKIAEDFHNSKKVRTMVHLPPSTTPEVRQKVQKLVPSYMKVTTKKEDWEKNSVVIYDEAAQTAHARRTQSGDAVELDNLIGVSGQRNQLLIFICHHSRKLDPNVVREVNQIIWKCPTFAHQLFERDELADFTMKAYDYFADVRKGKPLTETTRRQLKKHNLALDFDSFRFFWFDNQLPRHWTEELSSLFEDIQKVGRKAPGY